MRAFILAGGRGTRLETVSDNKPKLLQDIGGQSLLTHQLNQLKQADITKVTLLLGHQADQIKDALNDPDLDVDVFVEEKPLGTTGAIKALEATINEPFVVLYGDVMLNMDIKKAIQFHQDKQAVATLVVHPNDHPHDSDLLELDEDEKISSFYPKPHTEDRYYQNMVSAGLYIMEPKVLDYLIPDVNQDFGRDIFKNLIEKEPVYGYNTREYLKDMGTPDRLEKVRRHLSDGLIDSSHMNNAMPAVFLDRDGVINKEISYIHHPDQLHLLPGVPDAIKKINQAGYLAIVITNQSVIARNLCDFETLKQIHNKMETLLGKEGAKLDAIYFCPHHPDAGYDDERAEYKVACECRKPEPGLILQAQKRFNIDLSRSMMFGDQARDIACAKAAGVKAIHIRSAIDYDPKDPTQPDASFSSLYEGIEKVLN